MSLSGLVYEVSPEALSRPVDEAILFTFSRRRIAVDDLHRHCKLRFGSVAAAWKTAFNPDGAALAGSGWIGYTAFCHGCSVVGYRGDMQRLWAMVGGTRSGEIDFDLFSADAVHS